MADNKVEALNGMDKLDQDALDHEKWFDDNIASFRTLAGMVSDTLKKALDVENISYLDVPFREKNKESFLTKMKNKNKLDKYLPTDMTDLAGIRVITLVESDVQKVGKIIEDLFNVHPENSINKSKDLGENKVGYRSVHYVCDIGKNRENLYEWRSLKKLSFEIQVRTALEHAWAEIEHDRGYKLKGKLPSDLARRFSLLSALLESADMEFNRLTVEIEEYQKKLESNIDNGTDLDIELTSIGVKELIKHIFSDINYELSEDNFMSATISDVINFGITNLDQLKKVLINAKPTLPNNSFRTEIGLILYSLLVDDIDKYLTDCLPKTSLNMQYIPSEIIPTLKEKYKGRDILNLLTKHNFKVVSFGKS
ncbi:hypothetical protein [Acinetobacter pittii]|uniref:GTP pyrophosphokinase n=1 Tax=Acinetobacter pittii TaxID=48296 RepID=UPI00301CB4F6